MSKDDISYYHNSKFVVLFVVLPLQEASIGRTILSLMIYLLEQEYCLTSQFVASKEDVYYFTNATQ